LMEKLINETIIFKLTTKGGKIAVSHHDGTDKGNIMLYALSTCGWCRKTKRLLDDQGIEYDFIDIDLLTPDEKGAVMDKVRQWNPEATFPTVVVNGNNCIVGYDEDKILAVIS